MNINNIIIFICSLIIATAVAVLCVLSFANTIIEKRPQEKISQTVIEKGTITADSGTTGLKCDIIFSEPDINGKSDDNDRRQCTFHVKFLKKFSKPPAVLTALRAVDMHSYNRTDRKREIGMVKIEGCIDDKKVSNDGFDFVIRVWDEVRLNYFVYEWIAVGE